jgi:hypothetical protein
MWNGLIKCLVLYALLKGIRPNSSYYSEYLSLLDKHASLVPGSSGLASRPEATHFSPLLLNSSYSLTQATQLIFYILVVFFAPEISFKTIVSIDITCCLLEHLLKISLYFSPFRHVWTMKLCAFVLGFSLGTSNMTFNHIYSFVEKEHYHKITCYSRGASTVGSMIGNLISWFVMLGSDKFECYFEHFLQLAAAAAASNASITHSQVLQSTVGSLLRAQMTLNWLTAAFIASSGLFVVFIFKTFQFERKSEGKKRKWSLELFYQSVSELVRPEVWSLVFPWIFTMLVMLYIRLWCGVCWRHHQRRLNQPPLNGFASFFAHLLSLTGSMSPSICLRWFGQRKCMILQTFLLAAGIVCCMGQMQNLASIYWYYGLHVVLDYIVWFSSAFIGTEIAKLIKCKALIGNVFNLIYICIYSIRVAVNYYLAGAGYSPSVGIQERYGVVGLFMFIAFWSYLVQVVMSSCSAKGVKHNKEAKD